MDALWQIRLLGTLEARRGDVVLSRFPTSRVAALLARLALLPQQTHSREELAGLLWPDADIDAGRLNLRVALSSLRHLLEPSGTPAGSILLADRLSIRLLPYAARCDAAEFEAALREAARTPEPLQKRIKLEQALALYEGDLLPGFYDEWVLDERERLQALCEEAKIQCRALPPAEYAPALPLEQARDKTSERDKTPEHALLDFPGQMTRFFGRSSEKAWLLRMLADPEVRLVSLLGPGGAGKTRLALETARLAAGSFDGLLCFVPLADISDSSLIASVIASALRLPLAGDCPPFEQIAARFSSSLGPARSLLVLDNLEHLGAGGAAEVQTLLEAAPHLTCLVTSRQTLGIAGEHEMLLAPLPVPPAQVSSPETEVAAFLTGFPAVQLFLDRARLVRPDFQITARNADAVAGICRSLEGLPLALELAAARIQVLSLGQMQKQLTARLGFLTSRRLDLPPRHRSLRAALEWSAHLLTAEQTRFFSQLSLFRGGWSAEAAAAVCEVSDPLPLLEQLCERSLISAVAGPGELGIEDTRFRMLESLREFGEEQLTPEDKEELAQRHAQHFQTLAAQMNALWSGPHQAQAQDVLDAERDNLRAALSFCREGAWTAQWPGNEIGLRLSASLGNYWTLRGLLREGLGWLEGALAGPGSPAARAGALAMAGWLTGGLCEYPKAQSLLTEAVTLSRSLGETRALAAALRMRAVIGLWDGKSPPTADFEEALTLSRALGDDAAAAIVLNGQGILAEQWEQDKPKSTRLYEEALATFLRLGDQQRASYSLHNLGNNAYDAKDYDRAIALGRHSLALADTLGDRWHRAYCLRSLGDAVRDQGDLAEAGRLFEDGLTLSRQLGDRSTEAGILLSLAVVRRRQGDCPQASALARAALRLSLAMDHAVSITECWMNLADTAAASERWADVAALLSAADTSRAAPTEGGESIRCERLHHAACIALIPPAFDAAWHRGRTLTCDDYGLR